MDYEDVEFLDSIASTFKYVYSVPENLLGREIHVTAKGGRRYKVVITLLHDGPVEARERGEY